MLTTKYINIFCNNLLFQRNYHSAICHIVVEIWNCWLAPSIVGLIKNLVAHWNQCLRSCGILSKYSWTPSSVCMIFHVNLWWRYSFYNHGLLGNTIFILGLAREREALPNSELILDYHFHDFIYKCLNLQRSPEWQNRQIIGNLNYLFPYGLCAACCVMVAIIGTWCIQENLL